MELYKKIYIKPHEKQGSGKLLLLKQLHISFTTNLRRPARCLDAFLVAQTCH